ncbi:hypothetical protein U1Q18_019052 [Sarracenia purpurea var. burkii]
MLSPSTFPLFQRILRSDALSINQRSTIQRSLLCPSFINPQVPLTLFGVSGNYASALYLAAVKANALDKVESELLDLVEASKKRHNIFSVHEASKKSPTIV